MAGSRRRGLAEQTHLEDLPGHYVRRLQQIAVALFLQETADWDVTPVQYAAMQCIHHQPDLDQRSLARAIGFDFSTITGVVGRLEARGWITRTVSATDRRARLLRLTADGRAALEAIIPGMLRTQQRLLAPLDRREGAEFLRMLRTVVLANNELSRAPSDAD